MRWQPLQDPSTASPRTSVWKSKGRLRKNSAAIELPNGRNLRFARDVGFAFSSVLFWKGLDGFEPETSRTLRFFFERSATFVDVGANYGYYSILGALWNPAVVVTSLLASPPTEPSEPSPTVSPRDSKSQILPCFHGRIGQKAVVLGSVMPSSYGGSPLAGLSCRRPAGTSLLARERLGWYRCYSTDLR